MSRVLRTFPVVVIHAATSEGQVRVNYRFGAGTDFVDQSGSVWGCNVYPDLPPGEWVRIEQNIAADIMRLTPATLYQSSNAVWLWGGDFRIGDVRFSNSMTSERNSLLPGSIGQVACREHWEGTGGSPTPTYSGTARGGGQRRSEKPLNCGNQVSQIIDMFCFVWLMTRPNPMGYPTSCHPLRRLFCQRFPRKAAPPPRDTCVARMKGDC